MKIPAGVDDQTQLRLTGEGEPSPDGGPPGDCYCVIRVAEHPLFPAQRAAPDLPGADLLIRRPPWGRRIEVPTLDGPETIEVPPGTQSGDVFTLADRGMPDPRHRGRGDLLVQVHIEVPAKLSPQHEKLLRQLAEVENAQVSPQRHDRFSRSSKAISRAKAPSPPRNPELK